MFYSMKHGAVVTESAAEIMANDSIPASEYEDFEEGGNIYTKYQPGSNVPLEELLYEVIVNSDNTALNMLARNVGYTNLKQAIKKYSDVELQVVLILKTL